MGGSDKRGREKGEKGNGGRNGGREGGGRKTPPVPHSPMYSSGPFMIMSMSPKLNTYFHLFQERHFSAEKKLILNLHKCHTNFKLKISQNYVFLLVIFYCPLKRYLAVIQIY